MEVDSVTVSDIGLLLGVPRTRIRYVVDQRLRPEPRGVVDLVRQELAEMAARDRERERARVRAVVR